jgi:hypothetical protein
VILNGIRSNAVGLPRLETIKGAADGRAADVCMTLGTLLVAL